MRSLPFAFLALAALAACGDSGATDSSGGSTSTVSNEGGSGAGTSSGGGGATTSFTGGGGAGAGFANGGGGAGQGGQGGGGTGGGEVTGGGGAGGAESCGSTCFGSATWTVDNLSPCFFTTTDPNGVMTTVAISTHQMNGQAQCPSSGSGAPAEPWSTDSLTAACTGTYQLCVTLKAGDWHTAMPTDCTMATICTSGDYTTADAPQMMPDLPGWISDPSAAACVQEFITEGGYGLFSASGTADDCGVITPTDLGNIVTYCPLGCGDPNPPPNCATCVP